MHHELPSIYYCSSGCLIAPETIHHSIYRLPLQPIVSVRYRSQADTASTFGGALLGRPLQKLSMLQASPYINERTMFESHKRTLQFCSVLLSCLQPCSVVFSTA